MKSLANDKIYYSIHPVCWWLVVLWKFLLSWWIKENKILLNSNFGTVTLDSFNVGTVLSIGANPNDESTSCFISTTLSEMPKWTFPTNFQNCSQLFIWLLCSYKLHGWFWIVSSKWIVAKRTYSRFQFTIHIALFLDRGLKKKKRRMVIRRTYQ